ncbi:MAG: 3-hydroxyacyl-CoA dehydrogenase NAD-binding domain-containing protein, partial [Actinomycetota bacterium]
MSAERVVAVVVGTGSMGPEIAAALAGAGVETRIAGRDAQRTVAAAARAAELGGGCTVTPGPIAAATFAGAGLVVETIAEDAAEKRALYATVEPWCPADAVLATNTSSLRIADLAQGVARPARFAGFHFLKPAHLTGVVEVVPGPATAPEVTAALGDVAARMGKTALVVRRDVPGFIWNRIQFAVLRECLHMLEEGVAGAADIDAAVADGLAPRWMAAGPLATADLGGLATFARICAGLFPHLAAGTEAPAAIVDAARDGEPLQAWTRSAGADLDRLRAQALAAGARITAERRR